MTANRTLWFTGNFDFRSFKIFGVHSSGFVSLPAFFFLSFFFQHPLELPKLEISPPATLCSCPMHSLFIYISSVMISVTTLINTSGCVCMHMDSKPIFCRIIFYYFSSHGHDKPTALNKLCHS